MPYTKTKDGSLVNEVTLGDGYPLSNDLKPLKVGGEASPIEMSTSLPDGSDNAKVKVRGDLEVTGGLNFKNDVEVDLSFDDLSLSGDLDVTGDVTVDTDTLKVDATNNRVGIGNTSPLAQLHIEETSVSNFDQDNFANFIIEDDDARMQLVSNDGGSNGSNIIITNVDGSTHHNWAIGTATTAQNNILHIGYNTSTTDVGAYSFADLVITKDGKVGIGLTAPSTTLDVQGTVSYKHTAFTTEGPTDNVDVSGTTVLEVNTVSNNVTIGGFTGGVQGQILYLIKTVTANSLVIEHNEGGGSQDIFFTESSDKTITNYGGVTLYCNGTSWFALDS